MSDLIDRSELVKPLEMAIELIQALVRALNAEDDPEMKGELKAYRDILDGVKEMPSTQQSNEYNRGWKDGQDALREEMWERERDRLD